MPPSRGSSQSRDQTHLLGLLHWQTGSSPRLPPGNVGCGAHIIFRAAQSHIPSLVLVLGAHPKARLLFSVLIMKGLTPLPKQAVKVSTHIDLEWLHALSAAVPDLLMVLLFFCMLSQSCLTSCNPSVTSQAPCPWDSPGKNTGVGCHFLLQGIFSTQGSKFMSPACWQADSTTKANYCSQSIEGLKEVQTFHNKRPHSCLGSGLHFY